MKSKASPPKTNSLPAMLLPSTISLRKMASAGLSGTLLSGIGNLSHLRTLLLQNNQLSGPIAAEIGKLSELQTLDLSSNQFVGGIPSSLGLLSQLSYLWLSKNNLSGQIPPLVTNLTGLSFLHVLYSSMKLCNTFTSSISQVQFHNLIFFEGTCHLIISVVSLQKFWQKVT
ncbi:hypothetical protein Ahy_A03g016239 isoform B [Arachis hypogaea]|uniref:Disease resistance R13L4/SHOC-2-like LRR domain-containing protein n=2 Tax=Arachis hypogaea TaxID=3818 RepID=A0A445E2U8_ARAHY|nr:hypothetical protein Ahy_A03g016239 isoform B [Arachis hypogaea]